MSNKGSTADNSSYRYLRLQLNRNGDSIVEQIYGTTSDSDVTARSIPNGKGNVDAEHVEVVQSNAAQLQQSHYRPQTDEEKTLDRKVNLKLDLIVVSLLAVEFIVSIVAS